MRQEDGHKLETNLVYSEFFLSQGYRDPVSSKTTQSHHKRLCECGVGLHREI